MPVAESLKDLFPHYSTKYFNIFLINTESNFLPEVYNTEFKLTNVRVLIQKWRRAEFYSTFLVPMNHVVAIEFQKHNMKMMYATKNFIKNIFLVYL